jgi:plasmid stabilization system protein ParE
MAFKVVWTPEASESLDQIIHYLEKNWSEKEIISFIQRVNRVIHLVSKQPHLFNVSGKQNIRKAFITKHNSLFYSINETKNRILLISFWDNRQNPLKFI